MVLLSILKIVSRIQADMCFSERKVPLTYFLFQKKSFYSSHPTFFFFLFCLLLASCQANQAKQYIKDLQAFIVSVDQQASAGDVEWTPLEQELATYRTKLSTHLNAMSPEQKLTVEALFQQFGRIQNAYRTRKAREKLDEAMRHIYEWFNVNLNP